MSFRQIVARWSLLSALGLFCLGCGGGEPPEPTDEQLEKNRQEHIEMMKQERSGG